MRWTPKRKLEILQLIKNNEVSEQEIMTKHHLTFQELVLWRRAFAKHGLEGLKTTKIGLLRLAA